MFTSIVFLNLVRKTHHNWKMWKDLPIIAVLFQLLPDGCKTTESGSFLNTFSKLWLIWKSCEYDKEELCLQKILTLSILMFYSFKGEKYSKRNPRKFQGGYVCTKRARAKFSVDYNWMYTDFIKAHDGPTSSRLKEL